MHYGYGGVVMKKIIFLSNVLTYFLLIHVSYAETILSSSQNLGSAISRVSNVRLPTLRDFGMNLISNQGRADIAWLDLYWSSLNSNIPAILPAGAHWPDNRFVPNSNAYSKKDFIQFPIVTSFGRVISRPGFNTDYGFGIPYYGDVVPSFTHDDANFTFARVDGNEASAGSYVPIASVYAVYDTPNEGGATAGTNNQLALNVKTVTTPRDNGTFGNFVSEFYSKGYNYWGEMDVNKWSHTVEHGTNWVWDNIQEMYSAEPYYCDSKDSSLCFAEFMNEEDFYGVGPEAKASEYDPTVHGRQMFWLTTNHNINNNSSSALRWSPNLLVPAHKIITVINKNNKKEYMFTGVPTGYKGNSSWNIIGTVLGNTLTVTSLSSGKKIVPNSTHVFDNMLTDEIIITGQKSGVAGGVGVYNIKASHSSSGYVVRKSRNFSASDDSSHARFSSTGLREPIWTFNKGDTFADGTTTWTCLGLWQYDLGSVISVGGSNDPDKGYIERIGTILSEQTDYIYNAIFDMSKATFDPSVTHVFARMQKDMFLDLTADGTQAGQNNRLFGYGNGVGLEYKLSSSVNGGRADTVPFAISDTGNTHVSSLSIGNDSKKITDTRSIVFAENAEGGNPDHQISLRTSSSNAHLFADNIDFGKITTSISVPKSSHAPCHAGEEAQNSKYFYKCVASNQWKRIAWDKENW